MLCRRSRVRPVETEDTAQRPDPALLLNLLLSMCRRNFATAGDDAADKIALQSKRLGRMRRSRDLTYALGAEWWEGNGKTAAGARLFQLISIKLKYLHVILANLSVLRQRCDEPRAKWGHHA